MEVTVFVSLVHVKLVQHIAEPGDPKESSEGLCLR